MYLVINKCVKAVKVSNFSGHYLRNRSTLDIRNTLPKSGTFLLGHPVYATPEKLTFLTYARTQARNVLARALWCDLQRFVYKDNIVSLCWCKFFSEKYRRKYLVINLEKLQLASAQIIYTKCRERSDLSTYLSLGWEKLNSIWNNSITTLDYHIVNSW